MIREFEGESSPPYLPRHAQQPHSSHTAACATTHAATTKQPTQQPHSNHTAACATTHAATHNAPHNNPTQQPHTATTQ
ncbi:MAG: hypothetical protein KBS99_02325 [Prevotellaceae bacterium]|nr:hypothetical protein [Candidatus Colivivens caballi]